MRRKIILSIMLTVLVFAGCGKASNTTSSTPVKQTETAVKSESTAESNTETEETSTEASLQDTETTEVIDDSYKDIKYTGEFQSFADYDFVNLPFYLNGKVYSLKYTKVQDLIDDGWEFESEDASSEIIHSGGDDAEYYVMYNKDGQNITIRPRCNNSKEAYEGLNMLDCKLYRISTYSSQWDDSADLRVVDGPIVGVNHLGEFGTGKTSLEEFDSFYNLDDIRSLDNYETVFNYNEETGEFLDNRSWTSREYIFVNKGNSDNNEEIALVQVSYECQGCYQLERGDEQNIFKLNFEYIADWGRFNEENSDEE